VLAPDATDTQVQLDRLTRYGIVVLVVTASVAVSTATAAPNGPEARSYTSQAVNADGLRWQALADHHSQLESRPAASFYTPQALKAQGLRWQAMAQTYRTKSPAPAATISRSSGFDWDAALIGAAGSFGLRNVRHRTGARYPSHSPREAGALIGGRCSRALLQEIE